MFREMSIFVLSYVESSHLWVWQRLLHGMYITGYQSWTHLDMQTHYHLQLQQYKQL